ncbi:MULTISPECIES: DNA-directed RNA polymerase subunit beta [Enterococcus]|uniref:DNA-directed RNA polymerase subunit beta n=1 Tax=Enterococcus alcedinis TaxID=1274384 RepID=A0A917JCU4_9ENTE|nr:DNA-directed RNA polymerase subunit beta [Enterococcus alcedinis]MBP2101304.1 hypothetical protein [Enterococcus alcedinis]GGI64396.1 DNA-directed RNA polymerase subunit beta [Enterococcus alcedinis]
MKTSHYILYTVIKIIAVLLIIGLLFAVGLMIGYGVIGDGSPMAIFKINIWEQLSRFIK